MVAKRIDKKKMPDIELSSSKNPYGSKTVVSK